MSPLPLRLFQTEEFETWCRSLADDLQVRIHGRLNLLMWGHFADSRALGDGLFELKWKVGMRVYYSRKRVAETDTIVLWGGFKGTQRSDIARSRRLRIKYENKLKDEAEDD